MKRFLILAGLLLALTACGPDGAKCVDGTAAKSAGRGACSHHGGVAK